MSIRYTLRTLKQADVNLENLKRHELCLTETGRVMIRLHDDRIVDLSAAAADYAIQVSNEILQRGSQLDAKITQWQQLDNNAIQLFNEIYDEVQDDKDSVEILLGEVRRVSQQAYDYKVAAEQAKTETQSLRNQVRTDTSNVAQMKEDVRQMKTQAQDKLNITISYASAAQHASSTATRKAQEAMASQELAKQSEENALGYYNDTYVLTNMAKGYRNDAFSFKNIAVDAQQQASLSEQNAKQSELNAKESEDLAKESEENVTELEGSTREIAEDVIENANAVIEKANVVEEKEDIIQEILLAHANIKSITNAEIDDIWADRYVPETTGETVDRDGVYDLPIPIPDIIALFEEDEEDDGDNGGV